MLERYFAHTEETDAQLETLADATITLMLRVLKPLGDLITTLPVGPEYPGRTAGPSFELFYENDYLMPHREAAWALLAERLRRGRRTSASSAADRARAVAGELAPVRAALAGIADTLAAHLPAGARPQARPAPAEDRAPLLARPQACRRTGRLAATRCRPAAGRASRPASRGACHAPRDRPAARRQRAPRRQRAAAAGRALAAGRQRTRRRPRRQPTGDAGEPLWDARRSRDQAAGPPRRRRPRPD